MHCLQSNTYYIASIDGQTSACGAAVLINSSGKLGTTTSSRRFKEGIKPPGDSVNRPYLFLVDAKRRHEPNPADAIRACREFSLDNRTRFFQGSA
jgi:hypothetical protein